MRKSQPFQVFIQLPLITALFISGCTQAVSSLAATPSSNPVLPVITLDPSAQVISDVTTVYDYSTERCSNDEHPDLPARAFRDAEGNVQVIIASPTNYRLIGPNLDSLQPDCSPILRSEFSKDPSVYSTSSWLAATYTLDGNTVYGIVHNEYHGDQDGILPAACPSGLHSLCTLISLTFVVSSDGGKTYVNQANPNHLVAAVPYQYDPDAMRALWQPSNIVKNPNDGYYYLLVQSNQHLADNSRNFQGMCVMRTTTLEDPTSWRAWDGQGFNMRFINPYLETTADPEKFTCQLVSPEIGALTYGLSYSTYFDKFIAVGVADQPMPGFYFSLSDDLVNWSQPRLMMYAPLNSTTGGQVPFFAYPTLIDPQSPSDNFDIVGQKPFLYYVKFNNLYGTLDSDLLRVQVEFQKEPGQSPAAATSITTPEPVAVSMSLKETMLPGNTPLELTFGWSDTTQALVSGFLSHLIFEVWVDGVQLTDVKSHWGEILQMTPTSFSTRWTYPIGILAPGQHQVDYKLSVDQPFTDGSGATYTGEFYSQSVSITIMP